MMADTGAWLENTRQEIIDAIITKMNTFLQFALEISAQPSLKNKKERKSYDDEEEMTEVEKRSEALIAYLSTQLIVLSDNLYFPVFVRLLDGVWTLLLKDIELMIVPPINDVLEKTFVPNEEYRKLIPQFLDVRTTHTHTLHHTADHDGVGCGVVGARAGVEAVHSCRGRRSADGGDRR
jgi:hypothetical protein